MRELGKKLSANRAKDFKADPNGAAVQLLWCGVQDGFAVRVNRDTGHKTWFAKHGNEAKVIAPVAAMAIQRASLEADKLIVKWKEVAAGRTNERKQERDREDQLRSDLHAEWHDLPDDERAQKIEQEIAAMRHAKAEEERAERMKERARGKTLGRCLDEYMDQKMPALSRQTRTMYTDIMRRHCADWMEKPIRQITDERVQLRYREIINRVALNGKLLGRRGVGSAELFAHVLSAVWNHQPRSLGLGPSPTKELKNHREKLGKRVDRVKSKHLAAFWSEVEKLPYYRTDDYPAKHLLQFMVMTGLRRSNAIALTWDQVDLDNAVIRFPAEQMKAKEPLDLPISDWVVSLLRRRKAEAWRYSAKAQRYVFPSDYSKDGHVEAPADQLNLVCEKSSIAKVTLHGLRRTFTGCGRRAGVSMSEIGVLLHHHLPNDVTHGYLAGDDDEPEDDHPLRVAMNTINRYILRKAGVPWDGDNVVTLTRRDPVAPADRAATMTA